jgi:sugar lactone lactonase YvrE
LPRRRPPLFASIRGLRRSDWLPDGRLLVSGQEGLLVCSEHDGLFSTYADLRSLSPHGWNEIVVDGRGNVYVNSVNFDFMGFLEGRAQFALPSNTFEKTRIDCAS